MPRPQMPNLCPLTYPEPDPPPTTEQVAERIRMVLVRWFPRARAGEAVFLDELYGKVRETSRNQGVGVEMFHAALRILHREGRIVPVASRVGCVPAGDLAAGCSIRLGNAHWVLAIRMPGEDLDHWPEHVPL